MSSQSSDSSCENYELFDHLLSNFNTLKNFNDFITVMKFNHVERCEENDCKQCVFAQNLGRIFDECKETNNIVRLRFYCLTNKEPFALARIVIHRLATIGKERLKLEKGFNNVLALWNKKPEEIPVPQYDLGQ